MRQKIVIWGALTASCAILTTELRAQVCEGRPGAKAGNVVVSASGSTGNKAREFGVALRGLGERVYGGVALGLVSYDAISGTTTTFGGSTGYVLSLDPKGLSQLCPYVAGAIGFGPNNVGGTGVDVSSQAIGAGATWGTIALESGDVSLIPTINAGIEYASVKVSSGSLGVASSDTYARAGFGLGIVLSRQFTVLPSVVIPIGLKGSDPILSLSLNLSLGGSR